MAARIQPATAIPARVRTPLLPKTANESSEEIPRSVLAKSRRARASNPMPVKAKTLLIRLRPLVFRNVIMFLFRLYHLFKRTNRHFGSIAYEKRVG